MSCLLSHQPLVPQGGHSGINPPSALLFLLRSPVSPSANQDGETPPPPNPRFLAYRVGGGGGVHFPLVPSFMQGDSSSHFSVRITSSSSDIGKNEHTCRHGDQMEIDWGCPRAAAPSSPCPDRTGLLVSLHTRESRVWRHIRGESWPQTGGEGQVVVVVLLVVEVGGSTLKPLEVMSSSLRLKDGV